MGLARIAVALLWLCGCGVAFADTAPAPVVTHEMTATDIESFLDGMVPLQIETNDIAGVTIAIVKDGKLLFAKGYGFADLEARTLVSPETTLFRTGSITKLFTWTAVMQLVEQGKLGLDTDVNTYLDFRIGKPVTLRNLMTHRGGFEETYKNFGTPRSGKIDLGKYLRENIPAQIFEPGSTPSYSNYGATLAGYIVQRVSGVPFDQYVEDNIFKPLGMAHSTLRQPLPAALQAQMSKGYRLGSGGAKEFEQLTGYPAGSQSATAIDMTKFMLAHLSGGALGGARILKAETTALMHDTVTAIDPRMNGIALGFYEETRNGMRIIGHGGDTVYFHSDLHLVPSQNLGFFVSYNSAGRSDVSARSPLWQKYLDRYFPYEPPIVEVTKSGLVGAGVAGDYLSSRRAESSLLKFLTALNQPTVTANADGSISVDAFTGLNGQPRVWMPLGNGVFRVKYGQSRLVFAGEAKGTMRMYTDGAGVIVYERVTDSRRAIVILGVLAASLMVVFLNLVLWPVAAAMRWHYGAPQYWSLWEDTLRLGSMLASAAMLVFIGGIGSVMIGTISADVFSLSSTLDPQLHQFQQIGLVATGGVLIVLLNVLQAWRNPVRSFFGRVKETAVLAAMLGLVWFAWTMNMYDAALRF